jgi:hypothetical protein
LIIYIDFEHLEQTPELRAARQMERWPNRIRKYTNEGGIENQVEKERTGTKRIHVLS